MSQEIELKLNVERGDQAAVVNALRAVFPDIELKDSELRNIYFDTAALDLNQSKIALRIRRKDDRYIQTLKTQGQSINGVHIRGEWEWSLSNDLLDSEVLSAVDEWPERINVQALEPVFETNFRRYKADIRWQGLVIELAYDRGEVMAKGRQRKIHELEFELLPDNQQKTLKSNEEKVSILLGLVDLLGNHSESSLSLVADDISKAERGYELYLSSKS